MQDWSDGYVEGIDYQHGFYRELSPAQTEFALLLKGYRPPIPCAQGFRYAELGAGHANTSSLLAAVHPEGRFNAVDFNPSHIAGARGFAQDAGLDNLRLLEASFAEFATRSEEQYDAIILHGVWSWVSDGNRAILVDILRRKLRAGGVAFLSYNALPGKAVQMGVRKILLEHAATGVGDLPDRIRAALNFAGRALQSAPQRAETAGLLGEIERLKKCTPNYVAHEYLNRDWTAFYAGDVARELAGAKLSYAGPALMADELANLALPAEANALIEEADPASRETLRDIMMNRPFRRDLFVKGAERLSGRERMERLGAVRFALSVPPGDVPEAIVLPGNRLRLQKVLAEPLIAALDERPRQLDELARLPALAAHGREAILQGLTLMVGTSHAAPVLSEAAEAACLESAVRYNAAVLERNRMGKELRDLASPLLGSGISITNLEALFLLARNRRLDPVTFANDELSALGRALADGDGKPLTGEQGLDALREQDQQFVDRRLPTLRKLRIA